MRRSPCALTVVSSFLLASVGTAQPLGLDFRVNTYTTYGQYWPAVAMDEPGGFVVVWQSPRVNKTEVMAQRFAPSGVPIGGESRVNTFVTDDQSQPSIAYIADGSFVVGWLSRGHGDANTGVFAQRFGPDWVPLGSEFRVNTVTTNYQEMEVVAGTPSGDFVFVWTSNVQDGSLAGVFGQRFAAGGAPFGAEFRVNTYTTSYQWFPSVATLPAGGFVVVWESRAPQDGYKHGVFGQRFGIDGAPLGLEFQVNTYTTFYQQLPSVAASASQFLVVWSGAGSNDNQGVFGRRFDSTGSPLGAAFRVNTYTTGTQTTKTWSAAADSGGRFIVVWESLQGDGNGHTLFGQRFGETGVPLGGEFRVNTYTTGNQNKPAVAAGHEGRYVVAWASSKAEGDGQYAIVARRFGPAPVVPGDVNGDGNVNVTDVLYLINNLFAGGPAPLGDGDVNNDGNVNVTDVLYLINHLFAGGPNPL